MHFSIHLSIQVKRATEMSPQDGWTWSVLGEILLRQGMSTFCLFVCHSVRPSVCLSVCHLPICPNVYIAVCLVCLSTVKWRGKGDYDFYTCHIYIYICLSFTPLYITVPTTRATRRRCYEGLCQSTGYLDSYWSTGK